ncbi:LacI family DNA-binding transcriptional regulator [Streptomyces sp. DSM 42041]|uniref:LacI family DNA-binding transcriptional regulator n=1 Tax=Streptomyces hazeniae TaxID=3075538 RepID=A0ABU2NQK4_9ACTN|nr:LacI family DNA-binding transcriptional regulator [Streptomyces sp. DSM 42041]MDT0379257.1 LacI family DNA-binding transcriptional regulator [Streptomyces sp. DSM 42041]
MPQPVTMSDVARAAGVSVTTVSYVLSGKRPVAPHTRRAVEKAVADLGFTLNTVARNLRTGRSTIVALVVPDLANPFYAQLARGLQESLRGPGYHLVVGSSLAQRDEERAFLEEAVEQRMAGVVITPFRIGPDDLGPLADAGIPVVVSADVRFGDVDHVAPDSAAAFRDALAHVTAAGRRRVGMIAGPRDVTGGDPRLDVLRAEAGRFGLTLADPYVVPGEHTREAGAAAFEALMGLPKPPDAVFCVNDVTAVGALEKAEELGVDVPGDVALTGHDDIEFASLVRPRLSTVRYPAIEVGRSCARLLLSRLDGRSAARTVRVATTWVPRASA